MTALLIWTLTSGYIGHQVKCRGIAEALGGTIVEKIVNPGAPWHWLAPWGPAKASAEIAPPWPDILIASSRQTIPYARRIRRKAAGKTFVVVLDDPGIAPGTFDMVWTTEHDRLRGDNVFVTPTAPHPHTAESLEHAAQALRLRLDAKAEIVPLVGVLLGGASGAYSLDGAEATRLGRALAALSRDTGAMLVITPSRRTGATQTAALWAEIDASRAWIWDGTGDNPYRGILGLCDSFVATCDSVNMIGEAAFTGKPIQLWRLPGGSPKFDRFHNRLLDLGVVRWFDGKLAPMTYLTLNATDTIVAEIKRRRATNAQGSQNDLP